MIKIYNLDVGQADCILVYFEKNNKYFKLLVDGAMQKDDIAKKLDVILDNKLKGQNIQGIVLTHIDNDHISGLLDLVRNGYSQIKDSFLIFNKYDSNLISFRQAKKLDEELYKNSLNIKLIKSYEEDFSQELMDEINKKTDYLPVIIRSSEQRSMEDSIDQDAVNITILGPNQDNISKFMCLWKQYEKDKKTTDAKIVNRASIMMLIEFENKKIVLTGDGYISDINDGLSEIIKTNNEEKTEIDIVKAAHHGAWENNVGLLQLMDKYSIKHIFFTIDEKKLIKKIDLKKEHPSLNLLEEIKKKDENIIMTCSCPIAESGELNKYLKCENEIKIG